MLDRLCWRLMLLEWNPDSIWNRQPLRWALDQVFYVSYWLSDPRR